MTQFQQHKTTQNNLALQKTLLEGNLKKEILCSLMANPFIKKLYQQRRISRNVRRGITAQKTINLKMRNRLIRWLRQVNNETFHFSSKTLLCGLQILNEYLHLTNQHFSQLQLIGCACLYISSKIYESVIISWESYADCSGQMFTKQQLSLKEQLIFQTLDQNINFGSPLRFINKMKEIIGLNYQNDEKITEFIINSFTNDKFKEISEFQISLATIVSVEIKKVLSQQQVLNIINQGLFTY